VFPDNLKIAKVVPIFKSGDSEITDISVNIPVNDISKSTVHKTFIKNNYFIKNNLLSQQEYGFRSNNSTSLAVADLYENLLQSLDKNLLSCAVFIDLRKAPEPVNHSILLTKLKHYGVRGNAFKLIQRISPTENNTSRRKTLNHL